MKFKLTAVALVLVFALAAAAQAPGSAPSVSAENPSGKTDSPTKTRTKASAAPKAKAAEKKEETPAPAAPEEPSKGDTVMLKSGTVLKNVQVLRRLPAQLEVEVSPDVILAIPRKQIDKVIYDDIEPLKDRLAKPAAQAENQSNLIPGDKIKLELSAKLAQPIPEPGFNFVNQDILKVLDDLGKNLGIPIVVDDSVKSIPPEQRVVSLEIKPGATLTTVLQKDLLGKVKDLTLEYQFDHILVKKVNPVNALTPAPPAPSAAPVPPAAVPPASPASPAPAAAK